MPQNEWQKMTQFRLAALAEEQAGEIGLLKATIAEMRESWTPPADDEPSKEDLEHAFKDGVAAGHPESDPGRADTAELPEASEPTLTEGDDEGTAEIPI